MKTLVLKVDPRRPSKRKICTAASLIKRGRLVAFPTETVYGLGADALNADAVTAVFKAKNRPLDNPPIVHVADFKSAARLTSKIPAEAERLMKRFWPGPLTLIFSRSENVPAVTVAGLDTIAVRMPKHKVALELIRRSECPISAPSANLSGRPSPTTARHVLDDLAGRIDAVLDAGPTRIGVESTVLDMTVDPPLVLRPGGISFESLRRVLRRVELSPVATAEKAVTMEKVCSPGIKHKHYAPKANVILVEGEESASRIAKINNLVGQYKRRGKKVGVLCTDETLRYCEGDLVKSLGSVKDLAAVAHNLFRLLREFDAQDTDVIIAEGLPIEGLGLAIMNRLRKASSFKIVKV